MISNFETFNEGILRNVGNSLRRGASRAAASIRRGASETSSNIRRKASQIATGDREKVETNQDDLARQILQHLNSLPINYNRTGEFDIRTVNKLSNNNYSFFMTFEKSDDLYRIDISRSEVDFKTKSKYPEYILTITKKNKLDGVGSGNPDNNGDESNNPNSGDPNNNASGGSDDNVSGGSDDNVSSGNPNASGGTGNSNDPADTTPTNTNEPDKKKKFSFYIEDFLSFSTKFDNLKYKTDAKNIIIDREYMKLKNKWTSSKRNQKKYDKFDINGKEFWKSANGQRIGTELLTLAKQKAEKIAPELFESFLFEGRDTFGNARKIDTSKGEHIKCSQSLARDIYLKAEQIYKTVNKTVKGDARGGRNIP